VESVTEEQFVVFVRTAPELRRLYDHVGSDANEPLPCRGRRRRRRELAELLWTERHRKLAAAPSAR
jgi:hypothetical protein